MEANSKISAQCDSCKMPIARTQEEKVYNLQAQLINDFGEPKDYHFCDEECLRNYLNTRAKKRKTKASVLEIDLTKYAFTKSKP